MQNFLGIMASPYKLFLRNNHLVVIVFLQRNLFWKGYRQFLGKFLRIRSSNNLSIGCITFARKIELSITINETNKLPSWSDETNLSLVIKLDFENPIVYSTTTIHMKLDFGFKIC